MQPVVSVYMSRNIVLVFVIFLFAMVFAHVFTPKVSAEGTLKVATYNMLSGNSKNPNQMADYIIGHQFDLIVFQEADCREVFEYQQALAARNYPMEQFFATHSAVNYTTCAGDPNGAPSPVGGGIGMLSKYPILNPEFRYYEHGERVFQTALLQTDGGTVRVFNGHFWRRGYDVDEFTECPSVLMFMDWVNSYTDTKQKILLGDFNVRFNEFGSADAYKALCKGAMQNWDMSCKEPGRCAISHTGFNSVVDYVFVPFDSDLEFESSYVAQDIQLSDHFPAIATIKNKEVLESCSVSAQTQCAPDGASVVLSWQISGDATLDRVVIENNKQPVAAWNPTTLSNQLNITEDFVWSTNFSRSQSISYPITPGSLYEVRILAQKRNSQGQFQNVCSKPSLQTNLTWGLKYGCASPATPNPDYDDNGVVDIFDYNRLVTAFGTINCDVNLYTDCTIDIFDFNQLITSFGKAT